MASGDGELDALARDLAAFPVAAVPLVVAVIAKTSADIARDAQLLAPVETGNLRSSIGYAVTSDATGVEGVIGPTAMYGGFVEEGTAHMAAQPYLGPAFDRQSPLLDAALAGILERFGG